MKTPWAAVATLGVAMLFASDVAAQWNVARFGTEPNRVYVNFGLDPALITTVGYSRVMAVAGHEFQLSGDLGLVSANLDSRDFRTQIRVVTTLVRWRSLYLNGSLAGITRGTENPIYTGLNFGSDATASLGWYRSRWFASGEFGFDKAIITHLTHSDWYRKYFYPEAKDGWYLDAGGTYHYGVAAGVTAGRFEFLARAGFQRTEDWEDLTPPAYGNLGVGYGF